MYASRSSVLRRGAAAGGVRSHDAGATSTASLRRRVRDAALGLGLVPARSANAGLRLRPCDEGAVRSTIAAIPTSGTVSGEGVATTRGRGAAGEKGASAMGTAPSRIPNAPKTSSAALCTSWRASSPSRPSSEDASAVASVWASSWSSWSPGVLSASEPSCALISFSIVSYSVNAS